MRFLSIYSHTQLTQSCRYVWEGETVRVTADITTSDLLRIEVKAHQVIFPAFIRSRFVTVRVR